LWIINVPGLIAHLRESTTGLVSRPVRRLFRRSAKAQIQKSTNGQHDHKSAGAHKVGLKPELKGDKRSYIRSVWLPTLFKARVGSSTPPLFPVLETSDVAVTWTGHASFLVQFPGLNVLIDPNWAKWLKVIKRLKHPGIEIDHLPNIDLVCVTHAHFDHLDRRTLRRVAAGQPIVVPFEVGNLVHDLGFHSVHELGYWETYKHTGTHVTLTPCHHWGARVLHDTHRGFGGFILERNGRTVYHCGDTAYFPGFREIGKRFNIDVALLPIGAYDPPSGRDVHMNPEQAVVAFQELGAKVLVPMHYGTFRLGYEPLDEPLKRLRASAKKHGVLDKLAVMTEGKPVVF
jgi:L-ascorbate metabolism protein UlaG (beta-lactamase superfamily)